jgi:hypothetical protein
VLLGQLMSLHDHRRRQTRWRNHLHLGSVADTSAQIPFAPPDPAASFSPATTEQRPLAGAAWALIATAPESTIAAASWVPSDPILLRIGVAVTATILTANDVFLHITSA